MIDRLIVYIGVLEIGVGIKSYLILYSYRVHALSAYPSCQNPHHRDLKQTAHKRDRKTLEFKLEK